MQSIGRWIGNLSSAGVVAGAYGIVGLLMLLSQPLAEAGAVVAMTVVSAHVLLRPTHRGDVGRTALLPGALASTGHQLAGLPPWPIVVPLTVLVVIGLAYEDRERQKAARA